MSTRGQRIWMAGVAMALTLGCMGPASAYFPMGGFDQFNRLRYAVWPFNEFDTNNNGTIEPGEGLEIYIETGKSGFTDEEVEEVEASLQVWEDVPTSYASFRVAGHVQDPIPVGTDPDGRSMISMYVGAEDDTGEDVVPDPVDPGVGGGILGVTITLYTIEDTVIEVSGQIVTVSAGTILDNDIVISATAHRIPQGGGFPMANLQGTLVHELGHFLTLTHTPLNNLRALYATPESTEVTGLVENSVFWLTGATGEPQFIGVTPTMFPIYFEVEGTTGLRSDGGRDLAPDDISGVSFLYPRGSQSNFFDIEHEARSHTRAASGLPSIPLPGAHVVAWADVDNDPSTPRIPLFSTMTGLYEPAINVKLAGWFNLRGLWKQIELPGTQGTLFNPTYALTLNALNETGLDRQAPETILPEEYDSLQGSTSFSITTRATSDYKTTFPSEVFHEVENIVDISNKDAGTPLVWSFEGDTVISATTKRTLPTILPTNHPMFGDPNDVCPWNIIDTGGSGTNTTTTEGEAAGMIRPGGSDNLRAFRDRVLLKTALGTALVDLYYQAAPTFARFLLRHETLFGLFRSSAHGLYWTLENIRMITAFVLLSVIGARCIRRWRRARGIAAGLLVLGLIWCAGPADARIAFLTTADLAGQADAIETGVVESVESFWVKGGRIHTDILIKIDQTVKGALNENTKITVTNLGGRVDGLVMNVDEMPSFEVGEKVLLYLRELRDGRLVVYAGLRGKFRIIQDAKSNKEYVTGCEDLTKQCVAQDAKALNDKAKSGTSADGDAADAARIPLEEYIAYLKTLVYEAEAAKAAK